jgi:hypothetical protein
MIDVPIEKNRKKWLCKWKNCKKYAQQKNCPFALLIISSISLGKKIMLLKVSQAFVTIVITISCEMFLLFETLVVIMPSIIITMMWLL